MPKNSKRLSNDESTGIVYTILNQGEWQRSKKLFRFFRVSSCEFVDRSMAGKTRSTKPHEMTRNDTKRCDLHAPTPHGFLCSICVSLVVTVQRDTWWFPRRSRHAKEALAKSHKRQFVDASSPTYKLGTHYCSNSTNGSLWILQVRPIRGKQPSIKNVPSTQSC